ncbi:MAG: alpha/beta hydrolase [Alphaproteobacteria bacterium]|nr:alpha/beta hydrolase [Alphaproteobacteria bacterium]
MPGTYNGATTTDPLAHVAPEYREAARFFAEGGPPAIDSMETLKAARGSGAAFAAPRLPDVPVSKEVVPGSNDQPDVTVYVINAKPGEKRPAILHTHGGGFILGAAEWEVGKLQSIAKELNCVIVTVEYRLAPETRFTGSVEDNYAGLLWLYNNATSLGVDQDRIALMGESAGGGHAALLAIAARDRRQVPLVLQALIYPMLDDRTGSTRQMPPFIGAVGWNAASNRFGWECFLDHTPGGPDVPAAGVPARQKDLSGLAPTFIGVGGIDLFVSESLEYARRLTEAGVMTQFHLVPGAFHGFDFVQDAMPTKLFTKAKMNALRGAFGQPLEL